MKLDFKNHFLEHNSTDTNDTYSDTAALIAGVLTIFQLLGGIILNLLVILAIIKSPYLRKEYVTPSILSITMTDFIFSAYILPMKAYIILSKANTSPPLCYFDGYMGLGLWSISAKNLVGLAALRCIAVYFPRTTKKKAFQLSCKIVPLMCWIESFSTIAIFPELSKRVYAILVLIIGILLLLLNYGAFHQISKRSRKMFDQIKYTCKEAGLKLLEKEKRMGKMAAIITLTFFLIYIPITLVFLIDPHAGFTRPTTVLVTDSFTCLLAIIDPIVYIICHEKYRDGIKLLFERKKNNFISTVSVLHDTIKTADKNLV